MPTNFTSFRETKPEDILLQIPSGPIEDAVRVLDFGGRQHTLRLRPEKVGIHELVINLVGDDLGLCREFLADDQLKPFHLTLLQASPERLWIHKVKLVLHAAHSRREVASVAINSCRRDHHEWQSVFAATCLGPLQSPR